MIYVVEVLVMVMFILNFVGLIVNPKDDKFVLNCVLCLIAGAICFK